MTTATYYGRPVVSRSAFTPTTRGRVLQSVIDVDAPTTELFLPNIVATTSCGRHGARGGEYCFTYGALDSNKVVGGICNKRALKAGFNGEIKPGSLQARSTFRSGNGYHA